MQIRLPKPDVPIESQDDDILFAMLIFGEARGAGLDAKKGVGWVVKNRADHPRWWGRTLKGVILRPLQFSCFNLEDPNREKLLLPLKYEAPETWDSCFIVAKGILGGAIPDPTQTSDHYFDDSIKPPKWATPERATIKLGKLNFYRIEL